MLLQITVTGRGLLLLQSLLGHRVILNRRCLTFRNNIITIKGPPIRTTINLASMSLALAASRPSKGAPREPLQDWRRLSMKCRVGKWK